MTQGQHLALQLVEPHPADLKSSIQPGQIPLQGLPTLQQITTATQLGATCRMTEGASIPSPRPLMERLKSRAPALSLGSTAAEQPPAAVTSSPYCSLGSALSWFLTQCREPPAKPVHLCPSSGEGKAAPACADVPFQAGCWFPCCPRRLPPQQHPPSDSHFDPCCPQPFPQDQREAFPLSSMASPCLDNSSKAFKTTKKPKPKQSCKLHTTSPGRSQPSAELLPAAAWLLLSCQAA